jgi:hypothetical protein
MKFTRFIARTLSIAALALLLIASIAQLLLPPPWSSGVSALLGLIVGYWAFSQVDEYRWLQWFLSREIVPRSHLPRLSYPLDMRY